MYNKPSTEIANLFFFAMLGSLGIYIVLVFLIPLPHPEKPVLPALKSVFLGLSIMNALLSFFIEGYFGKKSDAGKKPMTSQQYTQLIIILCALGEAIEIYGLALYLLGFSSDDFLVFTGIAGLYFFHLKVSRMPRLEAQISSDLK